MASGTKAGHFDDMASGDEGAAIYTEHCSPITNWQLKYEKLILYVKSAPYLVSTSNSTSYFVRKENNVVGRIEFYEVGNYVTFLQYFLLYI